MCCSRTRSSFRILDTGCGEDFVAEIAAKLVRGAQIDLSATEKFRKLSLHSGQVEEAGRLARMELNQEIDVAILPKLALQSGTEEGEFPYPISFAEIGNLVPGESNTAFLPHLGNLLLRSPIEFNHVGKAINDRPANNCHGPGYLREDRSQRGNRSSTRTMRAWSDFETLVSFCVLKATVLSPY